MQVNVVQLYNLMQAPFTNGAVTFSLIDDNVQVTAKSFNLEIKYPGHVISVDMFKKILALVPGTVPLTMDCSDLAGDHHLLEGIARIVVNIDRVLVYFKRSSTCLAIFENIVLRYSYTNIQNNCRVWPPIMNNVIIPLDIDSPKDTINYLRQVVRESPFGKK